MDMEVFIRSVLDFIGKSNNFSYLAYSVLVCVLTEIVKKIFVKKVAVDVMHKFDVAVILPFIFGTLLAFADALCEVGLAFTVETVYNALVEGLSVGAFATLIFKFGKSISGNSLSNLLKDDVFGIFYTQMLYFGTAKQQMQEGSLTFTEFLQQVQLVASKAQEIYSAEDDDEVKRSKLVQLMGGIVSSQTMSQAVAVIHRALLSHYEKSETNKKTAS